MPQHQVCQHAKRNGSATDDSAATNLDMISAGQQQCSQCRQYCNGNFGTPGSGEAANTIPTGKGE